MALALVACNEKPEPEKRSPLRLVEGESLELEFDGYAATKTVGFEADLNWMVTLDGESDFFEVLPMYGAAGRTNIVVTVEEYVSGEALTGGFTLSAGDAELTFSVKQLSHNDATNKNVYIPDAAFSSYLVENFDSDGDGKISKEEALNVERIECSEMGIASLDGIKYFSNLKYLDCSRNVISGDFDLSDMALLEEAQIHHNLFTSINLSGCSKLVRVEANDNTEVADGYRTIFITEQVNLEGCSALTYLELTDNKITSIDLSDCVNLEVLRMTWNNLSEIDVTMCEKLTHLYVRKNLDLSGTLDLSRCPNLVEVWCAETKLNEVKFADTMPELKVIVSYDSDIAALDLSQCPKLQKLEAHSMKLTTLDVTGCPELNYVWLKFNNIEALDFTHCPKLGELQMGYNKVKTLDLSQCPELKTLEAAFNELESIDLSNCKKLSTVNLGTNHLTEVDVTDCEALFQIDLQSNELSHLDFSNKEELTVVNFENNKVEEVVLDNCPTLALLYASNNSLTSLDLRENKWLQEALLSGNNLSQLNVSGLTMLYLCEFNKNNLERLDLSGCTAINELYVQENPLAYFSVYECASLYQLDIRSTKIKSLDLSNNPSAAFLFATENPQLQTVYIMENASYSTLSVDDHVEVYYRKAGVYDDVDSSNWGDEDLTPWASNDAA